MALSPQIDCKMVTLSDTSPSPKVELKQEEVANDSSYCVEEMKSQQVGPVRVTHASASSLLYYYRRSRIVRSMAARKPRRFVLPAVKLMMSFHHIEYSQQTLFYSTRGYNFSLIVEKMKQSLSQVLVELCPLQSNNNVLPIMGIDAGVDFIEASAEFTREDAVDSNDPSVLGRLVPTYDTLLVKDTASHLKTTRPLLLVQVTELKGGTMALGWATNESMIDAASARQLLSSWAHLCKEDAGIPDLSITEDGPDINIDIDDENPVLGGWPHLMESRKSCIRSAEVHAVAAAQWTPTISMTPAVGSRLRMRTFRFSARAMEGLKSVANASRSITKSRRGGGGGRGSKLGAYSSLHSLGAHLWRSITRARNLSATASTRCSFRSIDISDLNDAVPVPVPVPVHGTATAGTLAKRSLAFAAALLHEYNDDHHHHHHATAANVNAGTTYFPSQGETVTSIQENINMVYVTKCEMVNQDSDFGWGSAMAMRSTSSSTSSSRWEDGQVTLFRGEHDEYGTATIDAEIMLSLEAMENMETDSAFMLSCS